MRITFSFHSQYKNGYFNPTFRSGAVQFWFDFMGRYWNVQGVYVKPPQVGQLRITQANTNGKGWMWASYGSPFIYLHPLVNWSSSLGDCVSCFGHEMCHTFGSNNHAKDPRALMHINGGICDNMIQEDYPWFRRFAWKSSTRPHEHPTALRDATKAAQSVQRIMQQEAPYTACEETYSVDGVTGLTDDWQWDYYQQLRNEAKVADYIDLPKCGSEPRSWWDWLFNAIKR